MGIFITKDMQLANQSNKTASKKSNQTMGTESFADYFRKGNVKHLEGAKMALSNGEDSKNPYFMMSKDGATVNYNGVTFSCNHESGALELGDCSNREKCIRVPLAKGGSLLFNPDSIGGVNKAIGMFSAEDQGRIMRAIQMYNLASQKLEEMEEKKEAVSENTTSENDEEASVGEEDNNNIVDMTEKIDGVVLREMTSIYEIYDIKDSFAV